MAALDFPDSPTVGDSYEAMSKAWIFNGSAWLSASNASGSNIYLVAESPITYDPLSSTIGLDEASLLIDGGTA